MTPGDVDHASLVELVSEDDLQLMAGLSGTISVTVRNDGNAEIPVDANIVFAGAIDQTGQLVADNGLSCDVGTDKGINAAVRCNGGTLGAGESTTIIVQGRGQNAGAGMIVVTLNPSRAIKELNYDNNFRQVNVAIN